MQTLFGSVNLFAPALANCIFVVLVHYRGFQGEYTQNKQALTRKDSGFLEVWKLSADSFGLLGWCYNLLQVASGFRSSCNLLQVTSEAAATCFKMNQRQLQLASSSSSGRIRKLTLGTCSNFSQLTN